MANGAWSSTDVDGTILAADAAREIVELQHTSGYPVYIAFGEAAVWGEGIQLSSRIPYYKIEDDRAEEAVHMICNSGQTASGGYETA